MRTPGGGPPRVVALIAKRPGIERAAAEARTERHRRSPARAIAQLIGA
jgi:hypothetical protein